MCRNSVASTRFSLAVQLHFDESLDLHCMPATLPAPRKFLAITVLHLASVVRNMGGTHVELSACREFALVHRLPQAVCPRGVDTPSLPQNRIQHTGVSV